MFEQYISDWLTSYLGHFLDIKRENLRANILSGKIVRYTQGQGLRSGGLDVV